MQTKIVIVIKKGINSVGPWIIIKDEVGGFEVAKFLRPIQSVYDSIEESSEIEVPEVVLEKARIA